MVVINVRAPDIVSIAYSYSLLICVKLICKWIQLLSQFLPWYEDTTSCSVREKLRTTLIMKDNKRAKCAATYMDIHYRNFHRN